MWAPVLLCATLAAAAASPLTLYVHPTRGSDAHAGTALEQPLSTLGGAQTRLRAALAAGEERDVVVELLPGSHRVPVGGLQLGAPDAPRAERQWVRWRGAADGSTSVSGGEPVTGWQPASGAGLPKGVMAAPTPSALKGKTLRHLYVNGARAPRTRMNATLAIPSKLSLTKTLRADGQDVSDSYSTDAPLPWSNPVDVEFVYPVGMSEPRCSVDRFERNATSNKTLIYMKQPCGPPAPQPPDAHTPHS